MKRIILSGCNGQMGRMVTACANERADCAIVAGIDMSGESLDAFPVFSTPSQCQVEADVLIDFSHPSALAPLLDYATGIHLPVVVATTGLSPAQTEDIRNAAARVPVFFTANMSLGVTLLAELARKAAAVLGEQFDIEIIEKHHNKKIDAPSGTALMLADEISDARGGGMQYQYDRHALRQRREKDEIGIHAVRGGTIVGEHEILFAGKDECLSLTHTASSRQVFAVGAINAALFLSERPNGLYSMRELVASVG